MANTESSVRREMYKRLWDLIEQHPFLSGMMTEEYQTYLRETVDTDIAIDITRPLKDSEGFTYDYGVLMDLGNPGEPNFDWEVLYEDKPPQDEDEDENEDEEATG